MEGQPSSQQNTLETTMKLALILISLFITASASAPAAAAIATPLSASLRESVIAPVETVQYRSSHTQRGHVAPADRDNGYGAYGYGGSSTQPYDWNNWSPATIRAGRVSVATTVRRALTRAGK
jgi:hypothetical protein